MLVLTRQLNNGDRATIKIGHDIEITLVDINWATRDGGAEVLIGIDAPRQMSVDRTEIWREKQEEGRQAG